MRFSRIAVTLAALLSTMGCTQEFMHEYEIDQTDLGAEGGYAVASVGYADEVGDQFEVKVFENDELVRRVDSDQTGSLVYDLRFGWRTDPWFSVEWSVQHKPSLGFEEPDTGLFRHGEFSAFSTGPQFRLSVPVEDAPVMPYLLGGFGWMWIDGSFDDPNDLDPPIRSLDFDRNDLYARGGAGIDIAILEGWFGQVQAAYDVGLGDLHRLEQWTLMAGVGVKW